jgi:spermidine/putrescine transport system permease protein
MQDWRSAKTPFALLLAPPMLWLAAFFLAPMVIIWAYSFGDNRGLTEVVLSGTLHNYARALEPLYLGVLAKSAGFAAVTTVLCLVVGFPVAVAIAFAGPRAKTWLLLLVMLPFWTNLMIRTYALMVVLRTEGLINQGLGWAWAHARLGAFTPLPLLHNDFAVVVGLVYTHLPLMILPLYAALDRLDRSLVEASLDLGAGHLETFARVVLPLAAPGIAAGVLLTFVPAVGAYLTPDLLGGPDSQMIANVIERQFKRANDWPFGAALSFLLMYLTLAAITLEAMFARRAAGKAAAHG